MSLAPQLHSRPQQEELSLSGITMALLGPLSHPPNAESFGIGASNMGAPGPPVKDPSFTPVRRKFFSTPRQCQYSPCAEGVHARTHIHTYMHTHAECRCVRAGRYTS